jgi:8'-apo-carotenoid 13,14-cleaving dioxygenase
MTTANRLDRCCGSEDEGWLIGLVLDSEHETTDLVILDAQAFDEAPVATVHLPHRVPPGFHGNSVPD